jgi:hypothetical protein
MFALRRFTLIALVVFAELVNLDPSFAAGPYSSEDLKADSVRCQEVLAQGPVESMCQPTSQNAGLELGKGIASLDKKMALDEIKREVKSMAESQIAISVGLLKKLGIQNRSPVFNEQLQRLKKNGFEVTEVPQRADPELLDKYLVASLRYHELKRQYDQSQYQGEDKQIIQDRIKLLELRFPLISQHNFSNLKTYSQASLRLPTEGFKEKVDEASTLDNFLFNDTPAKIAEINFQGVSPQSAAAKVAASLQTAKPSLQNDLRQRLQQNLEESLGDQLKALNRFPEFSDCELMTLHSQVSLRVVNSSANPAKVFSEVCECQKQNKPIGDEYVMGLGIVSVGGLALCMTPTGVSQVIGCPLAAIAGWSATGASALNFGDSLEKYGSLRNQGGVMAAMQADGQNRAELEVLRQKESELGKSMATDQMVGLIGFSVGHVGFQGLSKIYQKSKLSLSMKKLSLPQQKSLEEALKDLKKEEQTKAFVVLDKVDEETRAVFLKQPKLLVEELKKGGRCEI